MAAHLLASWELMEESGWEKRLRLIAAMIFIAAALLLYDLVTDFSHAVDIAHLAVEFGSILILGIVLFYLLLLLVVFKKGMQGMSAQLQEAETTALKWQHANAELARGISDIIQKQFAQWEFSTAEKEVGMLLLKGLSFREVAEVRGTSERTVRQQAQELYRKSGIPGRAAFSAFFLEDLLVIPGQ